MKASTAIGIGLALVGLLMLVPCELTASADDSAGTSISILDREAPGTGLTYGDVNDAMAVKEGAKPVILPLPAPLLGAAIGLLGVFAIKRRFLRS